MTRLKLDELEEHKEKMLKFCVERNLAIDSIIRRIEQFIDDEEYNRRGASRTPITRCSRLLIEALDAIRKLTGKSVLPCQPEAKLKVGSSTGSSATAGSRSTTSRTRPSGCRSTRSKKSRRKKP